MHDLHKNKTQRDSTNKITYFAISFHIKGTENVMTLQVVCLIHNGTFETVISSISWKILLFYSFDYHNFFPLFIVAKYSAFIH